MDGWIAAWGVTAMGQASSLLGSGRSSGSQSPRGIQQAARSCRLNLSQHDPRPLFEETLSAVVPRRARHPSEEPEHPHSPEPHMISTFTLTWVKATGTQSGAGPHP